MSTAIEATTELTVLSSTPISKQMAAQKIYAFVQEVSDGKQQIGTEIVHRLSTICTQLDPQLKTHDGMITDNELDADK